MALDRQRPSLLVVVMALIFGSVTAQVESYRDFVLCDLNSSNYLRVGPDSPTFSIKSPGYPKLDYPDNLNCSFVVESFDEPLVLLFSFVNFSVEVEHACYYDSLCLFGVQYCGSWEPGFVYQYILPAFSTSTIRFKTDNSIRKPGFKITVIPQLLLFGQTIQEARGTGSSYSNINFTANTYHPWNRYTDGCALSGVVNDRLLGVEKNAPESFTITELHSATELPVENMEN